MKIIAHRGAAGLALENTLTSIQLAKRLEVEAVEIDVRATTDRRLVLCHDSDLGRISSTRQKLSEISYDELKSIILKDSESSVPLLSEALTLLGSTPTIIEIKESGYAQELVKVLSQFPESNITIASFLPDELPQFKKLIPKAKLYGLHGSHAVEGIHLAKMLNLDGFGLKFWLLNPLTYWLAKRAGLNIYVYTVNHKFLARFISWFYPNVAICTDHPEWFAKLPKTIHRDTA